MAETLGGRLVKNGLVTAEQVDKALFRQKLHGGRLGQNLITLGFISPDELDSFLRYRPPAPTTVQETGLSLDFISELALKTVSHLGNFSISDVSDRLLLPVEVLKPVVQNLRQEKLCEVRGGTGYDSETYSFSVSAAGRQRTTELLARDQYAGPAPVPLEEYERLFEYQTVRNAFVRMEEIHNAFSPFVLSETLMGQLGPAINSGRSIFLYGPPGNGKTTIAETLGTLMGDNIYIPHAIMVDREIIRVFDPISHKTPPPAPPEMADGQAAADRRWVLCRRPVVLVGGELTLDMLELDVRPAGGFYEAPLQLKANGGIFIIDDFGRQMVRPQDLLNRWTVPLERRSDFLTLSSGKKFDIPFDQLVVFSTNIEPKELVDEAFLRRIRYKIRIGHPTKDEYREIFRRVCDGNGIEYRPDVVEYLLSEHYEKKGVMLNACHPRDLIDHITDIARFRNMEPALERQIVDEAWHNFFIDV